MTDKKKIQEELISAQEEAAKNLAGWQRAQADYVNFKKEMENRQQDLFGLANAAFMSEVLPVYNHFKLANDHIPKDQRDQDWVKGIIQIKKQFQDFLNKYRIEEIKTVGEKFDHNRHEAVVHEEVDGYDSDVIYEEVQPGYMINGKVLSPAKVKVAK